MAEERVRRDRPYRIRVETPTGRSRGLATRKYDVEMIRDFLVQLRQTLEREYDYNAKFHPDRPEWSCPVSAYAPEATSLIKKYGASLTPGLLGFGDACDACTPEEIAEAISVYWRILAQRCWEELQHLKALELLFEEALFCAAQEGRVVAEIDCAALLQGEGQRSAELT